MANKTEAIPSVRAKIFLIPSQGSGRAPLPPGLVESISFPDMYDSENFKTIGDPHPVDNVTNFVEGRIQFAAVFRDNNDVNDVLRPRIDDFVRYERFDVLAVDPVDNRPLVMAKGCRPQQFDVQMQGGRAARLNYSGIAQVCLLSDEINRALAV